MQELSYNSNTGGAPNAGVPQSEGGAPNAGGTPNVGGAPNAGRVLNAGVPQNAGGALNAGGVQNAGGALDTDDINALLVYACERNATDLHIGVGAKPLMRVGSVLEAVQVA